MKTIRQAAPSKPAGKNRPRLAAIDIGSNSLRCIIVEVDPQGNIRILGDEKAPVRLGAAMNLTGRISDQAGQLAIEALQRMQKVCANMRVETVAVVATSAVRKATNQAEFLRQVKKETGLQIQVISGEQEAELALLSVQHNFDLENQRYALADIGGGSVEIVIATGCQTEMVLSMDLGAVTLTEEFLRKDPVGRDECQQLRQHIRKNFKDFGLSNSRPISNLIGSGGTITNIGGMVMAMRKDQDGSAHRLQVQHSETIQLLTKLSRTSIQERLIFSGLNPQRADIILAGVILTDELMRHFHTSLLQINAKGIREGLILQGIQKSGLWPCSQPP